MAVGPRSGANVNFSKLRALLIELFQLDQPDLDFGFYRVLHARAEEVTKLLAHDLLPQVRGAFSVYRPAEKEELEKQLANAIAQAQSLGAEPDSIPKVQQLREQL